MFKALSRTGLEPASPDAGLENNLADRDFGNPGSSSKKAKTNEDYIRGGSSPKVSRA